MPYTPSASICSTFAGDHYKFPVGFHDVPPLPPPLRSLPYTKYLCIYFLGILVASVRLTAVIRQDRFRASWCVFLPVHFSCHCSINHFSEYYGLYPPCPVTWMFPLLLLPPVCPCSSLLSSVRGEDMFVSLLLQMVADHYVYRCSLCFCNSVARYFLLPYRYSHPSRALKKFYYMHIRWQFLG